MNPFQRYKYNQRIPKEWMTDKNKRTGNLRVNKMIATSRYEAYNLEISFI